MRRRDGLQLTLVAVLTGGVMGIGLLAQDAITRAPTAADWAAMAKLPDFGGVWETGGGGGARGAREGAAGAPAGGPAGARAAGAPPGGRGDGAPAGARGGGARGAGRGGLPLTPEAEAARQALLSRGAEDNATANCLPPGMPGIMGQPYPMEFLLTPGKVTIVIEAYQQVRHIYTDGRPLPTIPIRNSTAAPSANGKATRWSSRPSGSRRSRRLPQTSPTAARCASSSAFDSAIPTR